MKILFIVFIIGFLSLRLAAQIDHASNSFKKTYDNLFPTLKYAYDSSTQTHNYSGNWDFDGDKRPDSLFFIGNGGAHLYFHLRLKLSSEHIARNLHWLVSDFPLLDSLNHFKKVYGQYSNFPIFLVNDFNNDGKMDIYLNADTSFVPIPSKWKKRGVSSRRILISHEKKGIVIKNFPGLESIK